MPMSPSPDDGGAVWKDRIDDYLDGRLDEAGILELESMLARDADARRFFVRYARLDTDLHLESRARAAGQQALRRIEKLAASQGAKSTNGANARRLSWRSVAIAAVLFVGLGALGLLLPHDGKKSHSSVAWLVNAQNCSWSDDLAASDLQIGKLLQIEHGLAEIQFQCGARVIVEGPASLELLGAKSARLMAGKLTARASDHASGFTIETPHGNIVDLGTEFGLVTNDLATDVYVFEGEVEIATPPDFGPTQSVRLSEQQAARLSSGRITLLKTEPKLTDDLFVRSIVPQAGLVPVRRRLVFTKEIDSPIRDRDGLGTGLTSRLPGTGGLLAGNDANLHLRANRGQLELTTTESDLNTQFELGTGEYVGLRLSELGFTGREDFSITTTVANIPALPAMGQFGLYAGPASDRNIRGGLIGHDNVAGQYTLFLVKNLDGSDQADIANVGIHFTGTDIRMTLRRVSGRFSLTVENLTQGSTSTLTIRHPDFLDRERDLHVGLFGANTQSDVRKTLIFKEFEATVWTFAAQAGR